MIRITHAALAVAMTLALSASPAFAQSLRTSASGTFGTVRLNTGFEPDPHDVTVQAGGPIDAANGTGEGCVGMIAARPTVTLRYRAGQLPLYISSESGDDGTLVVRDPSGHWVCDDDSGGNLNPSLRIESPASGRYQIWVGRFGTENGTAEAILHISEIHGLADATTQGAPDTSLDPAYGVLDLHTGFTPDPATVAIQAGGGYDASGLQAPGCVGFIAQAPDYRVNYQSGALPLIFSVASDADTTLVVNTPDGQWHCDDDSGEQGMNPSIRFDQPQSGQYDIWVGTYEAGDLKDSVLNISEVTSQ